MPLSIIIVMVVVLLFFAFEYWSQLPPERRVLELKKSVTLRLAIASFTVLMIMALLGGTKLKLLSPEMMGSVSIVAALTLVVSVIHWFRNN